VGARAARQLASSPEVGTVVVVDRIARRAEDVARALGPAALARPAHLDALDGAAALLIAAPLEGPKGRSRPSPLEQAVGAGTPVVTVTDRITEVQWLLTLSSRARSAGTVVVVGAAMAPGLTDVLARWAAAGFDTVDEVHVSKAGTGGPACARQHHWALGEESLDWREGEWARRAGGSGRELVWFPGPLGGQDCYRAGLPDAVLLAPAFPGVQRVTARLAATRRDRVTAPLPMLRPPHPEGEVGAVRVEVRGRRGSARHEEVVGVSGPPAVVAGAVAAVSVLWALRDGFARAGLGAGTAGTPGTPGTLGTGGGAGAAGLAELVADPVPFLAELSRRGVTVEAFEGRAAPRALA